jgi:hypothetical protein
LQVQGNFDFLSPLGRLSSIPDQDYKSFGMYSLAHITFHVLLATSLLLIAARLYARPEK